jgi:hypothetical protein
VPDDDGKGELTRRTDESADADEDDVELMVSLVVEMKDGEVRR